MNISLMCLAEPPNLRWEELITDHMVVLELASMNQYSDVTKHQSLSSSYPSS